MTDTTQSAGEARLCAYAVYRILCPLMFSIAAVSIIPLLVIFIVSYIKKQLQTTKCLFRCSLALFIVIILTFAFTALYVSYGCHPATYALAEIFRVISSELYVLQTMLLIGILFYRLRSVFRNSLYRLPKFTILVFRVLYAITSILFVCAVIPLVLGWSLVLQLLCSLVILVIIMLIIYLAAAYIHRLFLVHQRSQQHHTEQDEDFLHAIVNTAVLTLISILMTVVTFAMIFLFSLSPPTQAAVPHIGFAFNMIVLADTYTNMLCILLSFKRFNGWYHALCGVCHAGCMRLVIRYDQRQTDATYASATTTSNETTEAVEVNIASSANTIITMTATNSHGISDQAAPSDGNSLTVPL
eukprot:CAMPEP_0202697884 /NCGR_PEP_ID=MMETSP1385-20130828/11183_1 /ASSEMBLY_ACC=CAM_ASM_000861 /TAXON_ID=933848 /ORGANISM="Elphidium margaritaceum" /LENGTH=355 /DNA_ID=CAMNT_0049354451 /DNA_START=32 /DNA_END=1099 /DNA_ORIENTATION=-